MSKLLIDAWICVALASGAFAQTAPFFDDVPSYKPYYNHVNLMRIRFVTTGCTFVPSKFCPEGAEGMLTRGQAAVLIIRSIYSGSTGNPEGYSWYNPPQYFADVPPSHPQYIYIQKMASWGSLPAARSRVAFALTTCSVTRRSPRLPSAPG